MIIVHAILDHSDPRPLCGAKSRNVALVGGYMKPEHTECVRCSRRVWAGLRLLLATLFSQRADEVDDLAG